MKKILTLLILTVCVLLAFGCSNDKPVQDTQNPDVDKPDVEVSETLDPKTDIAETEEPQSDNVEADEPETNEEKSDESETNEGKTDEEEPNEPKADDVVAKEPEAEPSTPEVSAPETPEVVTPEVKPSTDNKPENPTPPVAPEEATEPENSVWLGDMNDKQLLELARPLIETYFLYRYWDGPESIGAEFSDEKYLFIGPGAYQNGGNYLNIFKGTFTEDGYFENEDFKFGKYFGLHFDGSFYELTLYTGKMHNTKGEDVIGLYTDPSTSKVTPTGMITKAKKITNYSSKDEVIEKYSQYFGDNFDVPTIYLKELLEHDGALYEIFNCYDGRGGDPDANMAETYDTATVVSRAQNSFAIKCDYGYGPEYKCGSASFTFTEKGGKPVISKIDWGW